MRPLCSGILDIHARTRYIVLADIPFNGILTSRQKLTALGINIAKGQRISIVRNQRGPSGNRRTVLIGCTDAYQSVTGFNILKLGKPGVGNADRPDLIDGNSTLGRHIYIVAFKGFIAVGIVSLINRLKLELVNGQLHCIQYGNSFVGHPIFTQLNTAKRNPGHRISRVGHSSIEEFNPAGRRSNCALNRSL